MAVDSVLFYGHAEHLASRGTVDILSFCEYFGTPGFTGEVCQDFGLYGGEVADDELVSGAGHEGRSDQL